MELLTSNKMWEGFLKNSGYVLGPCLGNGSFGDVFQATHMVKGTKWAVKRLVARRRITEDNYAVAEIRALAELDHPNIVSLQEVLLTERVACLVLELATGGNLEILVSHKQGHLEMDFLQACFTQVLAGLDFCHASQLAHRDLNPSNILVFSDHLVKLADFGLCFKVKDTSSHAELLCSDYLGQEAYLAPEVKTLQPFLALPADIWSLGCVLWFMIQGEHPHRNTNEFLHSLTRIRGCGACPKDADHRQEFMLFIDKLCCLKVANRPSVKEVLITWEMLKQVS